MRFLALSVLLFSMFVGFTDLFSLDESEIKGKKSPRVKLQYTYWNPDFIGSSAIRHNDGIRGNTFAANRDLGMNEAVDVPMYDLYIGSGEGWIKFGYYRIDRNDSDTSSALINFGGNTYPQGSIVNSDIKFEFYSLEYVLGQDSKETFNTYFEAGWWHYQFDVEMNTHGGDFGKFSGHDNGVRAGIGLEFNPTEDLSFFFKPKVGFSFFKTALYDYEGGVSYKLIDELEASFGYKRFSHYYRNSSKSTSFDSTTGRFTTKSRDKLELKNVSGLFFRLAVTF